MTDCLEDLALVGTTGISEILGLTRHALAMRISRDHASIPKPDRELGGCLIWFATPELADTLGVSLDELKGVAGR